MRPRVISQADYERRHPPKPVVAPQAPKIDQAQASAQASALEAVKVGLEKTQALLLEELKQIRRDADIIPVYGQDKRLARIEIRYK